MREATWLDLRIDWEQRTAREAAQAERQRNLPIVDKEPKPSPYAHIDLGPYCDWSGLHASTCAHCRGIEDDEFTAIGAWD